MSVESMRAWEKRLRDEAFARGEHIPASWQVEHDDGGDGCMPEGWYLMGLDGIGLPVTFPIRHEYGPYPSEGAARADMARMVDSLKG